MATSSSIQRLRLPYTYNIASKTLAVIFVSTHLKGRKGTLKVNKSDEVEHFETMYNKDAEKTAEKYR